MDSFSSMAQVLVKHDRVDDGSGKWVKKFSKVEKPPKTEKLQRSLVWKNIYWSTNPPSIEYKEFELPLEVWQFFELLLLGPGALLILHLEQLPIRQKLIELLMLYHIFPPKKPRKSLSWILESFISYDQQLSILSFCLQNKFQPRISLMVERMSKKLYINKACFTFLKSSK